VSTAERTLRREPRALGSPLQAASVAVLERILPGLVGGALLVDLPDGTSRRFGQGVAVRMTIESPKLFRRLATRGKLGLGESYTAGEWIADDLVGLFELLLRNSERAATRHPRVRRLVTARPRLNRRTGVFAARHNIQYHYDLGNELFELFLDETMTYSAAVFADHDESLERAQERKLRMVCEKLQLGADDHLLELGCGWGSLALLAAREYGARVTAVTISPSQAALARERIAAAGLSHRVDVVEQDYRELDGRFSKLASVEMLEAIGEKQWDTFFSACDRLLAPHGVACIQTILIPDERFPRYRATPDWIERYVFPGCLIPSLSALRGALRRSSRLGIVAHEELGPHYAETLRRWRARFRANIDAVRALGYDQRFERTWDFYLAYCESAFRVGSLHDAQLVLARPGARA
jgi:cyclopropane-fatty-acyl-phospholipid synthase